LISIRFIAEPFFLTKYRPSWGQRCLKRRSETEGIAECARGCFEIYLCNRGKGAWKGARKDGGRSAANSAAKTARRTGGRVEIRPAGAAVSQRQKERIDSINTGISLQSVRKQCACEPVFRIWVSWRRIDLRASVPLSAGASSLQAMRASGIDLPAPLGVTGGLNFPVRK